MKSWPNLLFSSTNPCPGSSSLFSTDSVQEQGPASSRCSAGCSPTDTAGLGPPNGTLNHILWCGSTLIPPSETFYRKLFSRVSSELQKSTSLQLTRRDTSRDTKPGVCYHPHSPKASCRSVLPRNSEVLVLSEDQNVSCKRHLGPPGLVSEESYFKPHWCNPSIAAARTELGSQGETGTALSSTALFVGKTHTKPLAAGKQAMLHVYHDIPVTTDW